MNNFILIGSLIIVFIIAWAVYLYLKNKKGKRSQGDYETGELDPMLHEIGAYQKVNDGKIQSILKDSAKDLAALENFRNQSIKLWEMAKLADSPLLLVIMGEFKSGKSTFINAMLGEEVLGSDVTPATAVVTMVSYGKEKKVLAHFKDGNNKEFSRNELISLTAEGDDSKKELRKQIKYVEIFMPMEVLKKVTIVDTPGLNVTNSDHVAATKEFMHDADMVLWVFACGKAASRTEISVISELGERLKPIAIINRIDEVDEEEETLEDVICDVQSRLKDFVEDIIPLSALQAQKGIATKDSNLISESRWNDFLAKLDENIVKRSRDLKKHSILNKTSEFVKVMDKIIKETRKTLVMEEGKYSDKVKHKRDMKIKLIHFKELVNKSKSLRKAKNSLSGENLFNAWSMQDDRKLSEADVPFEFAISLCEELAPLTDTDKLIAVLQSYESRRKKLLETQSQIFIDLEQWNKTDGYLVQEYNQLDRQLNEYHNSGFFGGTPIFDFSGKGKSLEAMRKDYNLRLEKHGDERENIKRRIQDVFYNLGNIITEILRYLPKVEKRLLDHINVLENEISNYDKNFHSDEIKFNGFKKELETFENIRLNLVKLLRNNSMEYVQKDDSYNDHAALGKEATYKVSQKNTEPEKELETKNLKLKEYYNLAKKGDAEAQYLVGFCLLNGKDVKLNYKEALIWLNKSAKQGHQGATSVLSYMYYNGIGVEVDKKKSFFLQKSLAEKHCDPEDQKILAAKYLEGSGTVRNYQKAMEWFMKSAEQGDADSKYEIGRMYEYGKGVSINLNEAYKWYESAARHNHEEALKKLHAS